MELVIHELFESILAFLILYLLSSTEFIISKRKILTFVCLIIPLLSVLYFSKITQALPLIDALIYLLSVLIFTKDRWYQKLASFFLIYASSSFIYQSILLVLNILANNTVFLGMNTYREKIFSKLITIFILLILVFIKKKRNISLQLSFWNKICLFLFSFVVTFLITFLKYNQNNLTTNILNAIILICVTTIFVITFYLFSVSKNNRLIQQNYIQSQHIQTLKAYYTALAANEREIRKIKHDIRNHTQVLSNLISCGEYENAQKYIEEMNHFTTPKLNTVPNVGNALINAILLQKTIEYPDITIEIKGTVQPAIAISDFDLCTIISNLLDNALEYSSSNNFRNISFYIYQEGSILLIRVANTLASSVNPNQFEIHSSKTEKGHGYGITNVREAVYRNHGMLHYEQDNNKLYANAQLFFPS